MPKFHELGHVGKQLTDNDIKRYILEGHYGPERLEKELICCNAATYRCALEGRYGTLAMSVARRIRDEGIRRTVVRGPKPPKELSKTAQQILDELDMSEEELRKLFNS